jgi:hypothetical protein
MIQDPALSRPKDMTLEPHCTPDGRFFQSADTYNARRPRVHLTASLLSKPPALITVTELRTWPDGLRK